MRPYPNISACRQAASFEVDVISSLNSRLWRVNLATALHAHKVSAFLIIRPSSNKSLLSMERLRACFLNPSADQPIVDRNSGPMSNEHADLSIRRLIHTSHAFSAICKVTYLHHPPVYHRVHLEFPLKNGDLENSHPAEQPDLEEGQRQDVCLGRAIYRLRPVLAGHGRDGVVLEQDTKCDRQGRIYIYQRRVVLIDTFSAKGGNLGRTYRSSTPATRGDH